MELFTEARTVEATDEAGRVEARLETTPGLLHSVDFAVLEVKTGSVDEYHH